MPPQKMPRDIRRSQYYRKTRLRTPAKTGKWSDPEFIRAYKRDWARKKKKEDPEKARLYLKAWRAKNRAKVNEYERKQKARAKHATKRHAMERRRTLDKIYTDPFRTHIYREQTRTRMGMLRRKGRLKDSPPEKRQKSTILRWLMEDLENETK